MARVAFFIERLPPTDDWFGRFSYALVEALAEQEHEILVMSTRVHGHPGPRARRNVSLAFPFRSWNWIEAARAAVPLMQFNPDALHFVQPRREDARGWTSAAGALAAWGQAFGVPVVTSFFDLRGPWRARHRSLIGRSDAIAAVSSAQLDALLREAREGHGRRNVIGAVVPPSWIADDHRAADVSEAQVPAEAASFEEGAWTETLREFARAGHRVALAPGDVDAHADPGRLFAAAGRALDARPDAAFAIEGGWGSVPPRERRRLLSALSPSAGRRFALLGASSESARARLAREARVIFAATLGAETLALAKLAQDALATDAVLVAPPPVRSDGHADAAVAALGSRGTRAASDEIGDLAAALLEALDREPEPVSRGPLDDRQRRRAELADSPANVVSRLYAALRSRREFQGRADG